MFVKIFEGALKVDYIYSLKQTLVFSFLLSLLKYVVQKVVIKL